MHVGMNRSFCCNHHGSVGVPHARGDEPIWHWVVLTQAMVEKAAGGRLSLTAGILPNWERVKQAIGLTTYWGGSETEQAAAEYYGGRRMALRAASV